MIEIIDLEAKVIFFINTAMKKKIDTSIEVQAKN